MKKLTALLLAMLLALSFTACKKRDALKEESSEPAPAPAPAVIEPSSQQPSSEPEAEPEKLSQKYMDMLLGGTYYVDGTAIISVMGMKMESQMIIAVKGADSSISVTNDMTGFPITIRTITIDGKSYSVNDSDKSYSEAGSEMSLGSFNTDFSGVEYAGEGTGEFDGEELYYEEYTRGEDGVKLFFKDDKIAGLALVMPDMDMGEVHIRINGISENVPEHLVELPIGYTKK